VGHVKGGVGQVTVLAEMILSGISGSGTSDAAALGSLMIPAMVKEGYAPKVAAAINAASTTMGPIIPPSIMMIVYGAYGNVSIGALFLGGVLPGLVVGITQMITIYFYARMGLTGQVQSKFSGRAVLHEGKRSILALIVPIIIIGGIVGGLFTATEAAMVAGVYCLFLSVFVYREIKIRELPSVFRGCAVMSSHPMLCVAGAGVFGWVLAYLRVPAVIAGLASGVTGNALLTLTFVAVLFTILGTFMDSIPAIIIFLPIVTVLGEAAHINPVHMGVVVTTVMSFGLMTPPYGLTLLLSADLARVKVEQVMGVLLPFYLSLIFTIILLILFPDLALLVPRLLMPGSIR
jgi:tripartite ATP-independent transporter DctM subunit